jgi:hypothetical protein
VWAKVFLMCFMIVSPRYGEFCADAACPRGSR